MADPRRRHAEATGIRLRFDPGVVLGGDTPAISILLRGISVSVRRTHLADV
jgi:hypothetical protein